VLEIKLLGRYEVKLDGRPVTLPSRPAQSLLAYLALSAGTAHRREKLAGLLWPESSDDNARRNLRQSLWHIRKALADAAPHYLHSDDVTVMFAAAASAAPFWLDVALLEKPANAHTTPEELMAVVALYHDELLPGFYDDWVVWQRERQQTLFERKMGQLLDGLTAVHRWDELLEWAERWLAFGQSPEAAYRALMVAHAGRGDLLGIAESQATANSVNGRTSGCRKPNTISSLGTPASNKLVAIPSSVPSSSIQILPWCRRRYRTAV
jgi:DNA-binding SARP family transcriptional activator